MIYKYIHNCLQQLQRFTVFTIALTLVVFGFITIYNSFNGLRHSFITLVVFGTNMGPVFALKKLIHYYLHHRHYWKYSGVINLNIYIILRF